MDKEECVYKCLDPRGNPPDIEFRAPSQRSQDLENKTVFFVDIGKPGSVLRSSRKSGD